MNHTITPRHWLIFILVCLMAFLSSITGNGQTVKDSICACPKYMAKDSTLHQIFVGARGGKYILVTSKAGKVYKKYLTQKK